MSPVAKVVTDTAARLLLTPATVGSITEHDHFRTIALVGDRLVGTEWIPGDKLRIHVAGTVLRTYTPISWDRDRGATTLLAYLPDDGPGSGPGATWCGSAELGDACTFLGPKRSVRLDRVVAPPILVGDETSFGLFLAWQRSWPGAILPQAIFEVTSTAVATEVFASLGSAPADLVERTAGAEHRTALEDVVVDAMRTNPDAPLCLTGCAQTIAAVRRRVKSEGLARRETVVKAYWDENRKGLD